MVKKARNLKVLGKEVGAKKKNDAIKVLSRGQKRRQDAKERVSRKKDINQYLAKVYEQEANIKAHGQALADFGGMKDALSEIERSAEMERHRMAVISLERELRQNMITSRKAFESVNKAAMEVYFKSLQDTAFLEDPVAYVLAWLKNMVGQREIKQKELKSHLDAISAKSTMQKSMNIPTAKPQIASTKTQLKPVKTTTPKQQQGILKSLKKRDRKLDNRLGGR